MDNYPGRKELLDLLLKHYNSTNNLAKHADLDHKTVGAWFQKTEAELHRVQRAKWSKVQDLARKRGIEPLLHEPPLGIWNTGQPPEWNLSNPPVIPIDVPLELRSRPTQFLGHQLDAPFGASASIATQSLSYIDFLFQTGCAVVVFKTVRSRECSAHGLPNFKYPTEVLKDTDERPATLHVNDDETSFSVDGGLINRFGVPSHAPEIWQVDFRRALENLRAGQLLVLSVVGTADSGAPGEVLAEDFARVATMGVEAGAEVIELNLSCPNCTGRERLVDEDPILAGQVCQAVRSAVPPSVKLLAKIGPFQDSHVERLVEATVEHIDGYAAINTKPVLALCDGPSGVTHAFGHPDTVAGFSGRPLLSHGLRTVKKLAALRSAKREFVIVGIGGVKVPRDAVRYLESGADLVQATTGFFADGLLALRVRQHIENRQGVRRRTAVEERRIALESWATAAERLATESGDDGEVLEGSLAVWIEFSRRFKEIPHNRARRSRISSEDFERRIRSRLSPTKLFNFD